MSKSMDGTKKGMMKKKKKQDPHKIVGGIINSKIDMGKNKAIDKGKKLVHQGSQYLIDKGANKDLVNIGKKHLLKHGTKLINEGAGAAKHFIHTEGKKIAQAGYGKLKEGASHVKRKVTEKFNEFSNKLKRKR